MNFDFSEDQKLLQKTCRDYLAEHSSLAVVRKVLEGSQPYSQELWKGAAELGWLGAVIPEEYGGAGFGHLELVLIAEEVGRALAPIPFGSTVYLLAEALLLAGSEEQKKKHLPRIAAGELIGAFAFAEGPGEVNADGVETTFSDGRVSGTKVPVLDGDVAGLALVVARGGDGPVLALVDLEGDGVTREPVESFDGSRSQARIVFDGAHAESLGGAELISRLLDHAAVLMAFEQLGSAERCFELTKDFTMGRYAFGRPVASFQAVKHRLADLYCEIELARSNGYYAAWALAGDQPELPVSAAAARIQATNAFEKASVEMVQFYGGVGFTWEYDCHLFYRRSKLLALALGSARRWRNLLVDRLEDDLDSGQAA